MTRAASLMMLGLTLSGCGSPSSGTARPPAPVTPPASNTDTASTSPSDTSTDPRPTDSGDSASTTSWSDVDASGDVTCAVRADGALLCWGDPASPLQSPPAGMFRAVDLGTEHGCAIHDDGSLACWGNDDAGQASPPAGSSFTQVSAGGRHSCALDDLGAVTCWGDPADGRLEVPPSTYLSVAAGGDHTCMIEQTFWGQQPGEAYVVCVGGDAHGQVSGFTYLEVEGDVEPRYALAAGDGITCAITDNDFNTRCFGAAGDTRVSDQWMDDYMYNAAVAVGADFVVVMSGWFQVDHLHGWGAGLPWVPDGESTRNAWEPLPFGTSLFVPARLRVAAGADHVCALGPAGELFCLGENGLGQLDVPN